MARTSLIETKERQNVMRHDKREKLKVTYSLKMAMLLVSLFLICTNYAVGEQPNLTIKGNITNIPPGTFNIYK